MLSFLQFIAESSARLTYPTITGGSWYNSKTGQVTRIEGGHSVYDVHGNERPGLGGLQDATFHAGFVVKNPHHFGITPEELSESILQFENPGHPQLQTPQGRQRLAKKRIEELASGHTDSHPGVDSLVMRKGWVRLQGGERGSLWAQGKAPALLQLAKKIRADHPDVKSLSMDVHGANQTYGHLDPTIQGMAHALEGRDQIEDFIERGGAPHRSYTQIVRVKRV